MAQTALFQNGSDVLWVFVCFFDVAQLTTLKPMEHLEKHRLFVSQFTGNFKVMEEN